MALRRIASALVALAIASSAAPAKAERLKVALVNGNEVLERQVRIALSTWDLDVRRVDWTSLSSGMPGAAIEARQVAEAQKVDAVVWISETGKEHALWVYDAAAGHIVTRPLSIPPPTDAPAAASVALTLKTLMRSTTAAPPAERLGGEERTVGPAGVFRAEADLGGRVLATRASELELRVAISALWFPRFLNERAALAIAFSAGPGLAVSNDAFAGRFLDLSLGPALRFRLPLGTRFALEPQIGPTIHLTSLNGATLPGIDHVAGNVPVRSTHTDPSLDGSLLFSLALSRAVDVGVRGGASYLFRYQNYTVAGQSILELTPIQVSAALVLGARLN